MEKLENKTYERRQKLKNEILDTTIDEIKELSPIFTSIFEKNMLCAFGSSKIKEEGEKLFNISSL